MYNETVRYFRVGQFSKMPKFYTVFVLQIYTVLASITEFQYMPIAMIWVFMVFFSVVCHSINGCIHN